MRDNKEKLENTVQDSGQKEDFNEFSNPDYGLKSVADGCDFAEGEKKSPQCDRL